MRIEREWGGEYFFCVWVGYKLYSLGVYRFVVGGDLVFIFL